LGFSPQVSWLLFKEQAKRRYLNHNGLKFLNSGSAPVILSIDPVATLFQGKRVSPLPVVQLFYSAKANPRDA